MDTHTQLCCFSRPVPDIATGFTRAPSGRPDTISSGRDRAAGPPFPWQFPPVRAAEFPAAVVCGRPVRFRSLGGMFVESNTPTRTWPAAAALSSHRWFSVLCRLLHPEFLLTLPLSLFLTIQHVNMQNSFLLLFACYRGKQSTSASFHVTRGLMFLVVQSMTCFSLCVCVCVFPPQWVLCSLRDYLTVSSVQLSDWC